MDVAELSIPGAWVFVPRLHPDARGVFLEAFRSEPFAAAVGHRFTLAQVNTSVSRAATLRGVHYADVPPGQAKYVTCARGAVLDVVVDIRVGSPSFGHSEAVPLDDVDRRAVYLSEGLGHAFCALTDDATLVYLCSSPYDPGREHGLHPLDPDLALPWPAGLSPLLSEKDAAAPSLASAAAAGLLPSYSACRARLEELRRLAPAPLR